MLGLSNYVDMESVTYVQVKNWHLQGTAKLVFKPLTATIPGFGAVLVSLTEPVSILWKCDRLSYWFYIDCDCILICNLYLWKSNAHLHINDYFSTARFWFWFEVLGWRHWCITRRGENDWCKFTFLPSLRYLCSKRELKKKLS